MELSKVELLIFLLSLISEIETLNLPIGSSCYTREFSEGICTNYDDCTILQEQLKLGLIRREQVVICSNDPYPMTYVCCPAENQTSYKLDSDRSSLWNLIENRPRSCGKSIIGFGTVFNGTQVKRGAYPWNAALVKANDEEFFCGGSLVSKKSVITAAHCIEGKDTTHHYNPKDVFVLLGAHDLGKRHEPGRITASVKAIHVHHDWNPHITSYDADIAILKLADEVNFNQYIQPICLAVPYSKEASVKDGIIVGFGRSEHRRVENIPRLIQSPIHSHQVCANSSKHQNLLTHRTFCGGYANGTSVCEGDSGSGLIVKHEGVYYLRGIVSASLYDPIIGCNINSYSVFTNILDFYTWITTGKDEKLLLQKLLEEIRKLRTHITNTETQRYYQQPTPIDNSHSGKLTNSIDRNQPDNRYYSQLRTSVDNARQGMQQRLSKLEQTNLNQQQYELNPSQGQQRVYQIDRQGYPTGLESSSTRVQPGYQTNYYPSFATDNTRTPFNFTISPFHLNSRTLGIGGSHYGNRVYPGYYGTQTTTSPPYQQSGSDTLNQYPLGTGYTISGYGYQTYPQSRFSVSPPGSSNSFGQRYNTQALSSHSDDLVGYISESEKLEREQQRQIASYQRTTSLLSANEANRRTVNTANSLDVAAANVVGSTNLPSRLNDFDTVENLGGTGGFKRVKSWQKQSKWASGNGTDGQPTSYSMLSTAEAENHNINGAEAGYKAATTTLENDGKVSTYSIHTP